MTTKPECVVFDLDGTLCEMQDSASPYNHDGEEVLIPGVAMICEGIYAMRKYDLIILTGRKRKEYGKITEEWLSNNYIEYIELIMQEGGQAEKNHIYKEKELIKLQERYNIVAMVDDNPDLIPVCKKLGILLLQVHNIGNNDNYKK